MSEKQRPYFWWQGASVEELVARLIAAGPEDARLEVHIDEDQHATFVVKPVGAYTARPFDPPINESHICPPDCG